MAANTNSREFYDQKSGLKIRYDKGVDGENGFEAVDHYHVMNPNYTNKKLIIIWIQMENLSEKGQRHLIS